MARLCHVAPAQLPADPRELRHRLRDVHPAAVGMSRKRFRNVMADLVQALRIANHRVSGRRTLVPFTPEWQALHDACPTRMVPVPARCVHALVQRAGDRARRGRHGDAATRS